MDPIDIDHLRNPPISVSEILDDQHFVKAMKVFLATTNASEATYEGVRAAVMECYPEDPFLSYKQVRRRVESISGISPILHDMCIDTCAAFTGSFSELEACPICFSPRYHPGTNDPRRQFITIPIGPVVQAMYRSPEVAHQMHYRDEETERIINQIKDNGGRLLEYNDTTCGKDYLDAWQAKIIEKGDVLIQLSLDGAQLFEDKLSDCWISIAIFHNLPPDLRYTKDFVTPTTFIPGPHKPKHTDSFLYPTVYHLAALQKDGLKVWDAATEVFIPKSIPLLGYNTADGPAMAMIAGMVGHSSKFGCRLYCGMPGRHRQGDSHYYPLMQKPLNYAVHGCDHDDISLIDLSTYRKNIAERYQINLQELVDARTKRDYDKLRLATGLTKQTIFSALPRTLGIPNIFVLDVMHLIALNDPDLLIGLWRGTIKVYAPDSRDSWDWFVLKKDIWETHGKTVGMATQYIPSSFGRAPRNIAEKINSGYKAWEFIMYLFTLAPALLHGILPTRYWQNLCRFVRGIQLLYQRKISSEQIREGHQHLCNFHQEFEELYVQCKAERIHFLRQSIHLLTHLGPETIRAGPLISYSQWTMENLIGNLGKEIRQDKDPHANIAQRGLLRAQTNVLRNIVFKERLPSSTSPPSRPQKDLNDGFILLWPRQKQQTEILPLEEEAIMTLWQKEGWQNQNDWPRTVCRWARIRLPNSQVVRSMWGESKSQQHLRQTTIAKVRSYHFTQIRFILNNFL